MTFERPWGISVTGTGRIDVVPDLARVGIGVEERHATPRDALRETTSRIHRIREVVSRHGIEEAAVSQSQLSLQSMQEGYGRGQVRIVYLGSASLSIAVIALDDLGELLIDMVDAGATALRGVEFTVRDVATPTAAAREAAVADARAKAEQYALAAGVALGAVVHIEDRDGGGGPGPMARGEAMFAVAADFGGAPPVVVGVVSVTASVMLGFLLG